MYVYAYVCVYLCMFIMHICDRFRLSLASLSPALNILCQLLSIPFAFLQLFQLKRQKKLLPDAPQGKARQGRPAAQQTSRRGASSSSAASSSVQLSVSLPLSHCDRLRLANIISLCRMWQWIRINKYTNTHTHTPYDCLCVYNFWRSPGGRWFRSFVCVCARLPVCKLIRPSVYPSVAWPSLSLFLYLLLHLQLASSSAAGEAVAHGTHNTHANTHTKTEWMAG